MPSANGAGLGDADIWYLYRKTNTDYLTAHIPIYTESTASIINNPLQLVNRQYVDTQISGTINASY